MKILERTNSLNLLKIKVFLFLFLINKISFNSKISPFLYYIIIYLINNNNK